MNIIDRIRIYFAPKRKLCKVREDIILEHLKRGPVSSLELKKIAHNYPARIFNLRRKGHNINMVTTPHNAPVTFYKLEQK